MRRALCLLGICAWVTAQDLRTPGEEVLVGIKQALREARTADTVKLLGEIGGLYRYPASPEETVRVERLKLGPVPRTPSRSELQLRLALTSPSSGSSALASLWLC